MKGHADGKRSPGGLGPQSAFLALFVLGYAMGSPHVAPLLPLPMDRAFTKLHQEMTDAGVRAIDQASQTLQMLGVVGE